jgi:hypothetical protein
MRFLFLDPSTCSDTMLKGNSSDAVDYVSRFFCGVTDTSDIIFLPYIERLECLLITFVIYLCCMHTNYVKFEF